MIHHRSTRRLLCRLFAGMWLLAQGLVAAHACPVMAAAQHAMVMVHAGDAVPPSDSMAAPCEQGISNLCAEHCHAGQQSDQLHSVSVPPALPAGAHPLPAPALHAASVQPMAGNVPARAAAPAPHAILHCCFRI